MFNMNTAPTERERERERVRKRENWEITRQRDKEWYAAIRPKKSLNIKNKHNIWKADVKSKKYKRNVSKKIET